MDEDKELALVRRQRELVLQVICEELHVVVLGEMDEDREQVLY